MDAFEHEHLTDLGNGIWLLTVLVWLPGQTKEVSKLCIYMLIDRASAMISLVVSSRVSTAQEVLLPQKISPSWRNPPLIWATFGNMGREGVSRSEGQSFVYCNKLPMYFLQSGGWKSEIRVPAWWGSGESPLSGCRWLTSCCTLTWYKES